MNLPAQRSRRALSKLRSAASRPKAAPTSAAPAWLLDPFGPKEPSSTAGPKVVLLNDCRDQVNFGASVLVDGLVSILLEAMPTSTIFPIPSHWLMDTSGGFGAFLDDGEGWQQPQALFPTVADQFESIGDEWMAGRGGRDADAFLSRFEGASLVLLNGEGSIYRTNRSAITELYLAWLAKERLGIPTVFVNGTVHLSDVVPILPAMARKAFAVLDGVAVREPCSLRNVRAHVPGVDVQLFPDSAFVCTREDATETAAVEAVRQEIGAEPYFCYDPGAMPMDTRLPKRSALYDLVETLKEVVPRAVFVNSSPADTYIRRIAEETGSLYVDTVADYREYMALVGGAEFVVTGRYHNPILAAIMGTPSITFGSANHKVHGACEMLDGIVGSPYDGTDIRTQLADIGDRARRYVQQRDVLRQQLIDLCGRRGDEARAIGRFAADALARGVRGEDARR